MLGWHIPPDTFVQDTSDLRPPAPSVQLTHKAPESPAAGPLWQDASDGVFNVMHGPGSDVAGRLLLLGL